MLYGFFEVKTFNDDSRQISSMIRFSILKNKPNILIKFILNPHLHCQNLHPNHQSPLQGPPGQSRCCLFHISPEDYSVSLWRPPPHPRLRPRCLKDTDNAVAALEQLHTNNRTYLIAASAYISETLSSVFQGDTSDLFESRLPLWQWFYHQGQACSLAPTTTQKHHYEFVAQSGNEVLTDLFSTFGTFPTLQNARFTPEEKSDMMPDCLSS